jgi:hypothetical protein
MTFAILIMSALFLTGTTLWVCTAARGMQRALLANGIRAREKCLANRR